MKERSGPTADRTLETGSSADRLRQLLEMLSRTRTFAWDWVDRLLHSLFTDLNQTTSLSTDVNHFLPSFPLNDEVF